MSPAVQGREPASLFQHFSDICRIPHGSGNEGLLMDALKLHGLSKGWEVCQDKAGNMCLHIPATPGYQDHPTVCLQGHGDMVCEKDADVEHDFLVDPIELVAEGDILTAKGTTLGADNAIGLAAALAIAEDPSIPHPPLEILVTVGEEIGFKGADKLDIKALKMESTILINMDTEEFGELCFGSAGFEAFIARLPIDRMDIADLGEEGTYHEISITEMKGGHSGADINKDRGNAIMALGEAIHDAELDEDEMRIVSIEGGNIEAKFGMTALPREAKMVVFVPDEKKDVLYRLQERWSAIVPERHPRARFNIKELDAGNVEPKFISSGIHNQLYELFHNVENGIVEMDEAAPGMVKTSSNLGVMHTTDDSLELKFCVRSSMDDETGRVAEEIQDLIRELEGSIEAVADGVAWRSDPDSALMQLAAQAYKKATGKDAKRTTIHAGIEAEVVARKLKEAHGGDTEIQAISIGPDIEFPHSPDEYVDMKTVEGFYKQLAFMLKNL